MAGLVDPVEVTALKGNDEQASVSAKSSIVTVSTIFSVKSFEIPAYQREFSWKPTHIEDLFNDLVGTFYRQDTFAAGCDTAERSEYFLGVVVTQVRDAGEADKIVDGQQRITSLLLLFCALLPCLSDDLKREVLELIYRPDDDRFILDVASYNYFIRTFLKEVEGAPPLLSGRSPTRSAAIERFTTAHQTLSRFVRETFELPPEDYGSSASPGNLEEAGAFARWLLDKVYLVLIQDTDPYDEQRLFDRINTRGMPLSESERFMSKVLSETENRSANKAGREWRRMREQALSNLAHRAPKRTIRDPLEGEQKLLIGWLIGHYLPKRGNMNTKFSIAREISSDPYDWLLQDAEKDHRISKSTSELYAALKTDFFSYVSWSKRAYGACNKHDKELVGFRHAQLLRFPIIDALIASCYFRGKPDRSNFALSAASDFLDVIALRKAWHPNWKSAASLRDLLLEAISIIRHADQSAIRPSLLRLIWDAPEIDAGNAPSRTGGNANWIRYFLGRIAGHVDLAVMGRQPQPWYLVGTGNDRPEIEHVMSMNYHEFGDEFENDRDRMGQVRERLGALTLLPRKLNAAASNLDYPDRLKYYAKGPLLTAALRREAYNNRFDLRGMKKHATDFGFRHFDKISPELVEHRTQTYVRVAQDLWSLSRL
ncbi:MAG: DUF262 domain-containing protein [Pseudomonadota bacterium]